MKMEQRGRGDTVESTTLINVLAGNKIKMVIIFSEA